MSGRIASMVGRATWVVVAGVSVLGCAELNPEFDGPFPPGSTAGSTATSQGDPTSSISATSTGGSGSGAGSGSDSESASDADASTDDGESSTSGAAGVSLPSLRVDRACIPGMCNSNTAFVCAMVPMATDVGELVGEPGVTYDVTLHFRGVVEMSDYEGGMLDGGLYVGGGPAPASWDPYRLTVSDPPMDYWLNPLGVGDLFAHGVDFEYTLPVAAGATVELYTDSGNDSCGVFNEDETGEPIVIPGVDPAPDAFDGQFMQVDAVEFVPQG